MPEVKGASREGAPVEAAPGIHDRHRDPDKIADAAQQFEALLIGQLLKASHGPDGTGWMATGDDQAGAQAVDLAEEQLAEALARQGGLGLASLVVKGLQQKTDAAGAPAKRAAAPSGTGSPHAAEGAGSVAPSGPAPGSRAVFHSGFIVRSRAETHAGAPRGAGR